MNAPRLSRARQVPAHAARDVLYAELSAARLQGALGANPVAATAWRRLAMIEECRALASLRGPALSATALAAALWPELEHSRLQAGDGPAARAAAGAWRHAVAPGRNDARALLDAAALSEVWHIAETLHGDDDAPLAALDARQPDRAEKAALEGRIEFLAGEIARLREMDDSAMNPLFAAWTGVHRAWHLGLDLPAFGCILFQRLEAVLRDTPAAPGAQGPFWVSCPATAVWRHNHGRWTPDGPDELSPFAALARQFRNALGEVGRIADWTAQLDRWHGAGQGRSRRSALGAALEAHPLLSANALAAASGMTDRAARSLLARAEADGVIASVTPRARDRIWAAPPLAERLTRAPARSGQGKTRVAGNHGLSGLRTGITTRPDSDATYQSRIASLLDTIDSAIADIDDTEIAKRNGATPGETPPCETFLDTDDGYGSE